MSKPNTIDEILSAVYIAGISNGLHRDITDPEEIIARREGFIKANPLNTEAKAALSAIVAEIIGEDEQYDHERSAAGLKMRQRQRALDKGFTL